jgi:hypothetical protein
MDETIDLRSGSLNIHNGIVGLNFSCDGSRYMSSRSLQIEHRAPDAV